AGEARPGADAGRATDRSSGRPIAIRTRSASGASRRRSPKAAQRTGYTRGWRGPTLYRATKRSISAASRVLPSPASPVTISTRGSPRSTTSASRLATRASSVSRPTNGASSPIPDRVPGASSRPSSSYVSTGSRLPFSRSGRRCRQDARCRVATLVRAPAYTPPIAAASASRAAVFTVSPMTVYSNAACTPATTSPVFNPTRSPSGAPPPRSSSSTRRTARCIDSAARTARSASSSCATGAPKTAMMPSPVSLSTCPPKVLTAPASAAITRSMTAPTRSGSRSSAQAVKSDRSPNSTVTTRRSVAGSSAAAGSAAPQLWQNRAPGTATVPHTGQVIGGLRSPGRSRCVPTHTSVGRFQVGQLSTHAQLGRRPQGRVDVGVDDLDDLARGAGTGGQRVPHLGQPGLPVVQVGARRGAAVGQGRTMPRQYRPRAQPLPPLQARQVVAEGPVEHRGTATEDRVTGQHRPLPAGLHPEADRVVGVSRGGEQRNVQPVERAARLAPVPDCRVRFAEQVE